MASFFSSSRSVVIMLEAVLDIRNVEKAFKQVTANKGAGCVDGVQRDELLGYLEANWQKLRDAVMTGSYKPQPVRKVEIPKPGGGIRVLGIPTVTDRLLQQAIAQWLTSYKKTAFQSSVTGSGKGAMYTRR